MRGLYLGLDNTQPNLIRVVCVTTEICWHWFPNLLVWSRCHSLEEFQSFWQANLGNIRPDGLATTKVRHDPFGAIAWLEGQGTTFSRYHKHDLYHGADEAGEPREMPYSYNQAYSLALRAAFEFESPAVAIELDASFYLLQQRLTELRRILDGLVQVTAF